MVNDINNYNTKIDNPNNDGLITSIVFYIKSSDIFGSTVIKNIDVRRKNYMDFDTIFEQKTNKKYIRNNSVINVLEEDDLITCKELSLEEINEILNFISYNDIALNIFMEYLSKTKHKNILSEFKPKIDTPKEERNFNFEEYVDKKEDERRKIGILGVLSSQVNKNGKMEKVFRVKVNDNWETIYWSIYYKDNDRIVVDSEMCRNISNDSINYIKQYIQYDKRLNDDFDFYLSQKDEEFKQTKQY